MNWFFVYLFMFSFLNNLKGALSLIFIAVFSTDIALRVKDDIEKDWLIKFRPISILNLLRRMLLCVISAY